MSNIQEKAEQYAREKHVRSATSGIDKVNSAQDYTAGYNEAKRWIPVGERLPLCYKIGEFDGMKSEQILVKTKDGNCETAFCYSGMSGNNKFYDFYDSIDFEIKDVIEWREI